MDEESIYARALAATPQSRSEFLDEECGGDDRLRARLEAQLEDGSAGEPPDPGVEDPTLISGSMSDSLGTSATKRNDVPSIKIELRGYEVLDMIGRGGGGVVVKAIERKLERVVALKVLAPEIQQKTNALRRFFREAKALAAVNHGNVVEIYAICEEYDPPIIIMEFVDGPSLQRKIKQQSPMELRDALRIGLEIASGLSAAHEAGLIHRDIKPSNILLAGPEEHVKLTDFGLARAIDDVDLTKTGQVFGTPLYMSPEQARGQRVDFRSDIFSFGSVLYTICAGKPAFAAESGVAVAHRVIHDEPTTIDEINPQIPSWLCAIVERCLEKDPADRFESVRAISDLLSQHISHLAHPESTPEPQVIPRPARSIVQEDGVRLQQIGREMILLGGVSVAYGVVTSVLYRPTFGLFFVSLYLSTIAGLLGAFGGYNVLMKQSQKFAVIGCVALMLPVNPIQILGLWSTTRLLKDLRSDRIQTWFRPHSWWELIKLPAAFSLAAISLYILSVVVLQTMSPQSVFSRIKAIERDGRTTIIYVDR